jgi:hypothetical protein
VYAYLVERMDGEQREQFDQDLYEPPGAKAALLRMTGGV